MLLDIGIVVIADYTRKRIGMDKKDSWELRCGFLETEMQRTRYGYAMTPFPNLGGLDLAGLFMSRDKFVSTNVYFSKCISIQSFAPLDCV